MRVCQNTLSPGVRQVGREGEDSLRKRSHVADPGGPADLVGPRLGELGREGDSEEQRQERAAAVHRRPWVNLGGFEVGQDRSGRHKVILTCLDSHHMGCPLTNGVPPSCVTFLTNSRPPLPNLPHFVLLWRNPRWLGAVHK